MRTILATLALLNVVVSFADTAPEPRQRPRITEKMKLQLDEQTRKATQQKLEDDKSNSGAIELDPLEVQSNYRAFEFEHERLRPKYVPFTWKDGGTFWRREGSKTTSEWMIQYDPKYRMVKFFNLSF